jgi:hypothetical protein
VPNFFLHNCDVKLHKYRPSLLARSFVRSPSLFYLLTAGVEGFCFSLYHRHTPQSVGLLWKKDRPVAETSTWQHTDRRDQHPCPRWNSNPRSEQVFGRRPHAFDRAATGSGPHYLWRLYWPIGVDLNHRNNFTLSLLRMLLNAPKLLEGETNKIMVVALIIWHE